jgi:hypothetical protein
LAYASCKVSSGGYACAVADTSIQVWVEAVARAWAGAWAAGIQCDDKCFVEIEAVVEVVGKILADAATDAYAFVCGGVSLGCVPSHCIRCMHNIFCHKPFGPHCLLNFVSICTQVV